jgi:hypothetical protein
MTNKLLGVCGSKLVIITYSTIALVNPSCWSVFLGATNARYNSSISSLLNKKPMYVVLASDSEDISIYFFGTFGCCAQSRRSSHSAIELVGLVLDYHYHKPS